MSIKNWNAGIIRPIPVAPTGPYEYGAAPGVWTLDQVAYWQQQGLWPIAGNRFSRGLFGGGFTSATTNVIEYINISATSNSTDFGDLTLARFGLGACSSSTRGVFAGGGTSSMGSTSVNVIDYVTIASVGNATDFGDLLVLQFYVNGCSNSTRGIFSNTGNSAIGGYNTLNYITIASTSNATDFGDLTRSPSTSLGSFASSTRGVFGGGSGPSNVIDYITIATTGNATDFGDLTVARGVLAGCSSSTRGLFGGGSGPSNVIDYITIATTGNATDFGDLTVARGYLAACSSFSRGVFAGGYSTANSNVMDYVTIATTGNALDFGDLIAVGSQIPAGCSSDHGGLA